MLIGIRLSIVVINLESADPLLIGPNVECNLAHLLVAHELLNASVRITDLVINTATSTYGFGMALDFTADPPTLFGIALDSIGFKVTKTRPAAANGTAV